MSKHSFRPIRPVKLLAGMTSLLAVALVSCTATPSDETNATTDIQSTASSEVSTGDGGDLQVVTTILPITQFTKAVAGDRATVTQLLPTTADPHDFQAKPGDVQAIATADVLVKNGLELEYFLDDLVDNADNSTLVLIDSSEGIETIAWGEDHSDSHSDESHGEHDHDEHSHDEHDHDEHDHDEEKAHSEGHDHAHGSEDPHIWLDPKRAIEQVENIRDGLIAADPEGESTYTDNAASYISQLQDLDTEITEQLAPYAGQTFISFQDFAAYFAESYGLESEFLVDVPEANPSPDDMRRITETVEAENVKALLTEPSAGDSGFEALSKDLDIPVGVFDPVVIAEAAATENADYYLSTMLKNVENLESALQ